MYHRHGDVYHRHGDVYHRHGDVYHRHGDVYHRHGDVYHRHGDVYHRHGDVYHRHGDVYHRLAMVIHTPQCVTIVCFCIFYHNILIIGRTMEDHSKMTNWLRCRPTFSEKWANRYHGYCMWSDVMPKCGPSLHSCPNIETTSAQHPAITLPKY